MFLSHGKESKTARECSGMGQDPGTMGERHYKILQIGREWKGYKGIYIYIDIKIMKGINEFEM